MADQTVTVKIKFETDAGGAAAGADRLANSVGKVARERKNAAQGRAVQGLTAAEREELVGLEATARSPDLGGLTPDQARRRRELYAQQRAARHHDNLARAGFRDSIIGDLDAQRDAGEQARAEREAKLAEQKKARQQQSDAERRERVLQSLAMQRQWETEQYQKVGRFDEMAERLRGGHADQLQTAKEMHARGLNPDGSPMRGFDRLLSAPREPGAMGSYWGFAGRLSVRTAAPLAVAYAGKRVADAHVAADEIATRPFMRAGAISEQIDRANPILGGFYGTYYDVQRARSGEAANIRDIQGQRAEAGVRLQGQGQIELERNQLNRDIGFARNRADTFAGLRLDRLPAGLDRNTAGGQRAYDEALRLLPVQQRLTVASKERAAAEADFTQTQKEEQKRLAELAQAERKLNETRVARQGAAGRETVGSWRQGVAAGFAAGGLVGAAVAGTRVVGGAQEDYEQRAKQEAAANQGFENAQNAARDATAARKAAEQRKVGARAAEREAQVGVTRQQLATAEGRLEEARAADTRLGGMGVAGRQEALVALETVKRLGIDNSPPELVAQAQAAAPRTVGKMLEESGRNSPDRAAFEQLAPEDYLKTEDERRKVDKLREKGIRQEESGISAQAKESLDAATNGVVEEIARLFRGLEQRIRQFRSEREQAAGNTGAGG